MDFKKLTTLLKIVVFVFSSVAYNSFALADLTVSFISISPSNAIPGETVTVQYRITNSGDVAANNFNFRLYLSTNSTITTSDTYLNHTRNITSLAAGANTVIYSADIVIPSSTNGGSYYIGGFVDYDYKITESNETNNTQSTSISITDIDLTISTASINKTNAIPGDTVQIQYVVRNEGTSNATNFKLRYYISTNNIISTLDTYLNYEQTITLLNGNSSTSIYTADIIIPTNTTPGTRYIGAIVDYDLNVDETDESNNTRANAITINPAPDLTVNYFNVIDTSKTAGEMCSLEFQIINNGSATADNVNVRLYFSTNSIISIYDTYLNYETTITSIASDSSSSIYTTDVMIPTYAMTSTGYIGCIIDYNNQIPEIIESNNTSYGSISICAAFPELGEIIGDTSVCEGETQIYTLPEVSEAISYTWNIPSDWTGSSTTNSITCYTGSNNGTISVVANNACGSSSIESSSELIITPPTNAVSEIFGSEFICENSTQTYSVSSVSGASTYTWTLPSGWTGSSTSNSISCNSDTNGGTISIVANNVCGVPSTSTEKIVSITPIISEPTEIFGDTSMCDGETKTYSISSIAGAISYNWILPTGWTGSSNSNFINCTNNSTSGAISVSANNVCGVASSALEKDINIIIMQTPVISATNNTLHSNIAEGNQWYNQNGIIAGATDQDYNVTEDGEYYVIVTNGSCTSESSNILNIIYTQVSYIDNLNNIEIYPNPTFGSFNIKINNNELTDCKAIIYNTDGKLIKEITLNNNVNLIDISNLTKGIYFVKVINNKSIKTTKLILK